MGNPNNSVVINARLVEKHWSRWSIATPQQIFKDCSKSRGRKCNRDTKACSTCTLRGVNLCSQDSWSTCNLHLIKKLSLHIINPCWHKSWLHLFDAEPFVTMLYERYLAYARTTPLWECLHHCSTAIRLKRWERDKTSLLSWWDLSWHAQGKSGATQPSWCCHQVQPAWSWSQVQVLEHSMPK